MKIRGIAVLLISLCWTGLSVVAQEPKVTITTGEGNAFDVAFSPDGKTVASCHLKKSIKLWDVATGKETSTLSGHTKMVVGVAFSPDGKFVYSGAHDTTVRKWDVATGKELSVFKGHTSSVYDVAVSPNGKVVISCSLDNTIKLWRTATGELIKSLKAPSENARRAQVSPDGKYILSASMGGEIIRWDGRTGKPTLFGKKDSGVLLFGMAISPSGKIFAHNHQFDLLFRDTKTGRVLKTLPKIHKSVPRDLTFDPKAKYVATASDQEIKIWRITTGKAVATFTQTGPTPSVLSVAFSPNGKFLASSSVGGVINLWDTSMLK